MSKLENAFVRFAKERLTVKQKEILKYLSSGEGELKTATRLTREISALLNCSETAVRNNLNSLKRSGLIKNKKGKPVRLTEIGILIAKEVD